MPLLAAYRKGVHIYMHIYAYIYIYIYIKKEREAYVLRQACHYSLAVGKVCVYIHIIYISERPTYQGRRATTFCLLEK